jgi:glucoamylase
MPYLRAMERFASKGGLLPEQVWDAPDIPEQHMFLGRATGSATPLMWAHAEYVKLLRSCYDGKVYDYLPEVGDRYGHRSQPRCIEIWKPNRQVQSVRVGHKLRIQRADDFCLVWTKDNWNTQMKMPAETTSLGMGFVDLDVTEDTKAVAFHFLDEGCDREYRIAVAA